MAEPENEIIRHALKTAREFGFRQVRLVSGDLKFSAVLDPDMPEPAGDDDAVPLGEALVAQQEAVVESPSVGYFNLEKGVRSGSKVQSGDVLGRVMAVGHANEVHATATGQVTELLVKDGDALEYGQAIARIKR